MTDHVISFVVAVVDVWCGPDNDNSNYRQHWALNSKSISVSNRILLNTLWLSTYTQKTTMTESSHRKTPHNLIYFSDWERFPSGKLYHPTSVLLNKINSNHSAFLSLSLSCFPPSSAALSDP